MKPSNLKILNSLLILILLCNISFPKSTYSEGTEKLFLGLVNVVDASGKFIKGSYSFTDNYFIYDINDYYDMQIHFTFRDSSVILMIINRSSSLYFFKSNQIGFADIMSLMSPLKLGYGNKFPDVSIPIIGKSTLRVSLERNPLNRLLPGIESPFLKGKNYSDIKIDLPFKSPELPSAYYTFTFGVSVNDSNIVHSIIGELNTYDVSNLGFLELMRLSGRSSSTTVQYIDSLVALNNTSPKNVSKATQLLQNYGIDDQFKLDKILPFLQNNFSKIPWKSLKFDY